MDVEFDLTEEDIEKLIAEAKENGSASVVAGVGFSDNLDDED